MNLFHIRRHTVRKPAGTFQILGEFTDHEMDTQQCCHCGEHFLVVAGSGITRGFCLRCNQVTCGAQWCQACIPWEQKLELAEK